MWINSFPHKLSKMWKDLLPSEQSASNKQLQIMPQMVHFPSLQGEKFHGGDLKAIKHFLWV